jgi:tellurium resistance protein TerD
MSQQIYEVINLQKGGRIDLSKAAPGVSIFAFALGWDPQQYSGADFDLDATAFLTKGGKCVGISDLVGYMTPGFGTNGVKDYRGFASHSGDDLTGGKAGDDETITINTARIDINQCDEIQFNVTIYEAKVRKQTFGQVNNAFIRVYDPSTGKEICRYDLTEDYSNDTAVVIGKLYYKDGSWRFQAVGGGYKDGLSGLVAGVGLAATNG